MYLMSDLISILRNTIGDTNLEEPNITNEEMEVIINNSAREYSRIKNYIKIYETPYDKNEDVYDLPNDVYKVKNVIFKNYPNYKINFIDNLNQIILENQFDVKSDTLRITYSRYFTPEEIDEREIDILMLYAEALCYKLMASKTAELIKFSTGEKMFDESLISDKYLALFNETVKVFKNRLIKAYGKRANNIKPNLDYDLPYPPIGESP